MASPHVLLTALWLLESFHSQYRSSARVVLYDYLNYVRGCCVLLRCA